jgi:hypothetical protein
MPDRLLRARIRLADGQELRTINDALVLIKQRFDPATKCDALDEALVLLAMAADTGKRTDIKMATDQLLVVLRDARMI